MPKYEKLAERAQFRELRARIGEAFCNVVKSHGILTKKCLAILEKLDEANRFVKDEAVVTDSLSEIREEGNPLVKSGSAVDEIRDSKGTDLRDSKSL